MQQTFPAETIHRVVLSVVNGDLTIHGWKEQAIQVEADDYGIEARTEGDTLTIGNIESSLTLWVPVEIGIHAESVSDDATIESVREIEIGDIKNGASLSEIVQVKIGHIGSDLSLDRVVEAITGNVDGDLNAQEGIGTLRCGSIGGDCHIQGEGNADIALQHVGGDAKIEGVSRLMMGNIGGDCNVQNGASAEIAIGHVGADLVVVGAARIQAGHIGSDCTLRDIQGDVTMGTIGSDAKFTGIGGNVRVGNIGSDADLQGLHGSIQVGPIGSDLRMQATFPAGSVTRLSVGADAHIALPENASLIIRATVGGSVHGHGIEHNSVGNLVKLVYGAGAAVLVLRAGGDLHLQSNISPRSSQNEHGAWGNFEYDMSELAREMERLGRNIHHEVSSAIHEAISHSAHQAEHYARQHAEEQRHHFKDKRRRGQRPERRYGEYSARINDREWHMDPERIQQILEQARQAAAHGVKGALEAVEQALKNLSITLPPMPEPAPTPPMPEMPPVPFPPVAPMPPQRPEVPRTNLEQERKAILYMIAEGRISPEEGDQLLEALGG